MCCCELLVAELLVSTRSPRYITELYNPNKYSSRSVSNTDAYQSDDVSEAKKTQESNFLCIISSRLWLPPAKITRHTEAFMQVQHERWTCASGCAGRLISCTATNQSLEHWDWKHNLKSGVEINHILKWHKKKKYERHRRTSMCRNIKHSKTLLFRKTRTARTFPFEKVKTIVSCCFSSYNIFIWPGIQLKKKKHFFDIIQNHIMETQERQDKKSKLLQKTALKFMDYPEKDHCPLVFFLS